MFVLHTVKDTQGDTVVSASAGSQGPPHHHPELSLWDEGQTPGLGHAEGTYLREYHLSVECQARRRQDLGFVCCEERVEDSRNGRSGT